MTGSFRSAGVPPAGRAPSRRPTAVTAALLLFAMSALAAPQPKSVTLDAKDEDVRLVLKSMQKQCAVKNLILDPDVQGKGTFFFTKLPCATAFDVVYRTLGLRAKVYSSDVVDVTPRSK